MTIGERIRKRRLELGLTQRQLALGISDREQYISDWERGRRIPGLRNATKLAAALGISLDELVGSSGEAVR